MRCGLVIGVTLKMEQGRLYKNDKLEVRKSPIHGYGVFAKEGIGKGELLEECHYIKLVKPASDINICNRMFCWPKQDKSDLQKKNIRYMTLPLGYGCIYNSSSCDGMNNADWDCDTVRDIYVFKATKDIPANTEILTYYGDTYKNACKLV